MSDSTLRVHVNPKSSKNQVMGMKDGVLYLKLTAPPVDGAANKSCAEFLSDLLGIRKSAFSLVSGDKSREKVFRITGLPQERLDQLVTKHISA